MQYVKFMRAFGWMLIVGIIFMFTIMKIVDHYSPEVQWHWDYYTQ